MSKQVQLRGGTTAEHMDFIGAPREVTVDTDLNTLRVHDGQTPGGHDLAKTDDVVRLRKDVQNMLDQFEVDLGTSHNHDDRYSKIGHNHDDIYARKLANGKNLSTLTKNDYQGFAFDDGSDTNYIRTTKNGIIPYQSGGYSNIGTSSWRFANGYFNNINTTKLTIDKGEIDFNGEPGQINFHNDDILSYNDETNEFTFTSDGSKSKSRVCVGVIEVGGKRIYIGSSFPSDARTNDILIQV